MNNAPRGRGSDSWAISREDGRAPKSPFDGPFSAELVSHLIPDQGNRARYRAKEQLTAAIEEGAE